MTTMMMMMMIIITTIFGIYLRAYSITEKRIIKYARAKEGNKTQKRDNSYNLTIINLQ
jgi:hypothetical protein